MLTSLADTVRSPEARVPSTEARIHDVRAEIVDDYDAFVTLEAEWNDAVNRARVPHPFLTHEWLRAWWDSFGGSKTAMHIIVVRDGQQIVGIAPLMRESTLLYGLPVRRLTLMANDHTPRADVIVTGSSDVVYQTIWNTLRDRMDEWDVLQLTQLPAASPTATCLSRCASADRVQIGTWRSSDSPYLELHGTWDSYWASRPAKFRSNVRNRLARITPIGEPRLEVLENAESIAAALDDAWRLEASGWKDEAGTAITSDVSVQRFYTLLAQRAVDRGWLRVIFLTVAGKRIAVSYSAVYGGRLFLLKTGHDREFHTCSPFKLLTYLAVQDGYARGLREIDFLGDAEPWKQEWTPAARGHEWLFVFSRTRRARLLHSLKFQMAPEIRKWRT